MWGKRSNVAFVNAVGGTIPPVFVFPRKKTKSSAIGSLGLVHESGWMTSENFLAALVHFQSHVGATKERTVLILMDNHVSHMDFPLIE